MKENEIFRKEVASVVSSKGSGPCLDMPGEETLAEARLASCSVS